MWFKRSIAANLAKTPSSKSVGQAAEDLALQYLLARGLLLVTRNFKTPGRGGGEIDLIMRTPEGVLVFVEVRQRSSAQHGGAAASVSVTKRQRIIFAAQQYLQRLPRLPRCRFDVIALDQGAGQEPTQITWLQAAFEAN